MALLLAGYLLFVNGISGYLMYSDKQKAIRNEWRVPESYLFFFCLVGGFIGTFLAMKYARHKTKHWQFHTVVILSSLIWVIIFPVLGFLFARGVI